MALHGTTLRRPKYRLKPLDETHSKKKKKRFFYHNLVLSIHTDTNIHTDVTDM